MYPQRYAHPSYRMPYQVGPNEQNFGSKWPIQHRNRPTNYHSKRPNNFKLQTANEEHWCETCDKGFPTLYVLENHKKQHQKCNIDGCQFVAHPKVITKHIQMQHSTGLFKKIANLNKPEDIKKWREERKNRYPTKENIQKKIAEIKEKVERGEKMGIKQSQEHKSYKTDHGTKRKLHTENNRRQQFKRKFPANKCSTYPKYQSTTADLVKKPCLPRKDNKLILPVNDLRTLKPFTGILHLLNENEEDSVTEELTKSYTIEDDEYADEELNQICNSKTSKPVVCGALSSLMSNYESSDNESIHEAELKYSNEENENKSTHEDKQNPENLVKHNNVEDQNNSTHEVKPNPENIIKLDKAEDQNRSLVSNGNVSNNLEKSDDESGPEEVKILKIPNIENEPEPSKNNNQKQIKCDIQKKVEKTRHNNVHNRNNTVNFKPKLPSTLLEKLLSNEIRQERNIVLQCIRHIVKCNYFEKTVENK